MDDGRGAGLQDLPPPPIEQQLINFQGQRDPAPAFQAPAPPHQTFVFKEAPYEEPPALHWASANEMVGQHWQVQPPQVTSPKASPSPPQSLFGPLLKAM
jgi:hypothetical protein